MPVIATDEKKVHHAIARWQHGAAALVLLDSGRDAGDAARRKMETSHFRRATGLILTHILTNHQALNPDPLLRLSRVYTALVENPDSDDLPDQEAIFAMYADARLIVDSVANCFDAFPDRSPERPVALMVPPVAPNGKAAQGIENRAMAVAPVAPNGKAGDQPTPKMFRVYHAIQNGVSQQNTAAHAKISQPTVSRYNNRVQEWIKAGGVVPEINDLNQQESRPKMLTVDPHKMARLTAESDDDVDE